MACTSCRFPLLLSYTRCVGSGCDLIERSADQAIFDAYCIALDQATERVRMVELALKDWASIEPYATPV
ncbi:MAG: hypothetical protein JRE43_04205, partial [Deltaproteobacteria bacterium]|nr:hypothetical protein [Deltaproteobacteria bacterium]